MTEQLMDTLSNEEHERLLLMSEHAIAAPLSPAAQAVLNAAEPCDELEGAIAAALRAVAEQVLPLSARRQLLAMADELEGNV
jgi:hypothetical protein